MKKYMVLLGVTLFSGLLELSKKQASARESFIKAKGKNIYEIVHPVFFKQGEIIGYDGPVSKTLMCNLEDIAALKNKKKESDDSKKHEKRFSFFGKHDDKKVDETKVEELKKLWEENEELREDFNNDFDAYLNESFDKGN